MNCSYASTDRHKYSAKERTFWSDGYFVCYIGEASAETIQKYIMSQKNDTFIPSAEDRWTFYLT